MEKTEQYRQKLKLQSIILAVCCLALLAFSLVVAAAEAGKIAFFTPVAGDSHWQSMWRGFVTGAAIGLFICMLVFLMRNVLALRSEEALKKRYVKDHDERTIQIWTSARALSMQIVLPIGLVAIVVSGYFSMNVSITIWACLMLQIFIGLGCKFYYSTKF